MLIVADGLDMGGCKIWDIYSARGMMSRGGGVCTRKYISIIDAGVRMNFSLDTAAYRTENPSRSPSGTFAHSESTRAASRWLQTRFLCYLSA
jgi:hypothetical protein